MRPGAFRRPLVGVVLLASLAAVVGCSESGFTTAGYEAVGDGPAGWSREALEEGGGRGAEDDGPSEFPVPPPPFSEGMWPCTRCHETLPDNFVKRKLVKEHTNIVLDHGPREKWCFSCHIQKHRAKLRLASGATVRFDESYKLCGQCHGPKLRDWRVGVHGKRTGSWNGEKQYLLCAHCHDPHSPRFKPLKPKPPPIRPEMLRQQMLSHASE